MKTKSEEERKQNSDRDTKKLIIVLVLLLLLLVLVFGITYSVFNYTKKGDTDNTITTGKIKFLYTENTGVGHGISISNALPVSDIVGKSYVTEGYVFDFKVTGDNFDLDNLEYEITARMSKDSTLPSNIIKVYLVELDGSSEIPSSFTTDNDRVKKFSELIDTSLEVGSYEDGTKIVEKTIYKGIASGDNYEKNFRFRMWISDDADFSPITSESGTLIYPYNGKIFTATINVYATS